MKRNDVERMKYVYVRTYNKLVLFSFCPIYRNVQVCLGSVRGYKYTRMSVVSYIRPVIIIIQCTQLAVAGPEKKDLAQYSVGLCIINSSTLISGIHILETRSYIAIPIVVLTVAIGSQLINNYVHVNEDRGVRQEASAHQNVQKSTVAQAQFLFRFISFHFLFHSWFYYITSFAVARTSETAVIYSRNHSCLRILKQTRVLEWTHHLLAIQQQQLTHDEYKNSNIIVAQQ